MSWFNASQLSSFAKQALSQAQKSIDRVLDIQEEEPSAWAEPIPYGEPGKRVPGSRACSPSDPSPPALAQVRVLLILGVSSQSVPVPVPGPSGRVLSTASYPLIAPRLPQFAS